MKKWLLCFFLILLLPDVFLAQGSPDYGSGIRLNISNDGSKYIRILAWGQVWLQYADNKASDERPVELSLRRARVLTYAQITPKFLILTHFGLNSMNSSNMSSVGKGASSQLFFHDVWVQYQLHKNHEIGAGLHYWNGVSRINSAGTINSMTLDNNRQSWSILGLSDQFARHLGVYFKGNIGSFFYRMSVNEAMANSLDERNPADYPDVAIYGGRRYRGSRSAGLVFSGYYEFALLDHESNFLPFRAGSYLGTKKILNVGLGGLYHPNGVVRQVTGELESEDVTMLATDVFCDLPVGKRNAAVTVYGVYQYNHYGRDYLFDPYGTGGFVYTTAGFVLPSDKAVRIQSYLHSGYFHYTSTIEDRWAVGVGTNLYLNGHNSKLTLEYKYESFGLQPVNSVTLQAMIYL